MSEIKYGASSEARASLRCGLTCLVLFLVAGVAVVALGIIGPERSYHGERTTGLSRRFSVSEALLEPKGKTIAGVTLGIVTVVMFGLTGIPALLIGRRWLRRGKQQQASGGRAAVGGIAMASAGMLGFSALMVAVVPGLFQMASEVRSAKNLWALTFAIHAYHDAHNQFPPAAFSHADFFEVLRRVDPEAWLRLSNTIKDLPKDSTPLLSWRVLILPYLLDEGGEALFKKFHLHEPWDSPHNKALLPQMPKVFAPAAASQPYSTYYQVFVGEHAVFRNELNRTRRIIDLVDGTSNTVLLVEAAEAVPWTKPEDLPYDPHKPLPRLGVSSEGFCAAFADLGIWFIHRDFDETAFRAAITPQGAETFEWKDLRVTKLIPSPNEWPDVYKYFIPGRVP
jgi:hypothetical protein